MDRGRLSALRQPFAGIGADRLQHPASRLPLGGLLGPDQALGQEFRQVIERLQSGRAQRDRDRFRGLEGQAAGKDGEAPEQGLLVRREEIVAPADRRAQGLLSIRVVPRRSDQEIELGAEAVAELTRREDAQARRGQLQRQGQAVETVGDLGHRGGVGVGQGECRVHGLGTFHEEVTGYLVTEKIYRRFMDAEAGGGPPDTGVIRAARTNVRYHLHYIGYLLTARAWLAGDGLTYADLAAAAHLSCADYLGDVPWNESETARSWYARVKARPAFRTLLADRVPGIAPADGYATIEC